MFGTAGPNEKTAVAVALVFKPAFQALALIVTGAEIGGSDAPEAITVLVAGSGSLPGPPPTLLE